MFSTYRAAASLALLAVGFTATPARTADSPEALATAYFQTVQEEGLGASTSFMHPSALAEFKSILMPVYDAEHAAGGKQLLEVTFPGTSYAALQRMDAKDFTDGFMNLVIAQTGNVPIRFDRIEVLGTIAEGDARHVLTRMTVGAGELAITQFEVLSFVPFEETWRLQLNGDMKGLATALRANLPAPPPAPDPAP